MTYTLTEVQQWGRATLDDRAKAIGDLAVLYRQQLANAELSADRAVQGWDGTAANAATERMETEIRLGRNIVDAVESLEDALRRHAGSIQGVRDNVLAKVADARDEFGVSDTFEVDESGPADKRQHHVDAISAALTELAEVDRQVAFAIDACCDEIAAYARDARRFDDYTPPPTLVGLSGDDITQMLDDPDFKEWVDEHPDAAKSLLDAAVDAGTLSRTSTFYQDFLQGFWQREALERAGIDVSQWNPEDGTAANAETITKVYEYYGQLFLDHPELQWAGMANMIGPSFAGGFYDLDMLRDVADQISDVDFSEGTPGVPQLLLDLAGHLTEDEISFYETTLLSMQKEIFLDQGAMHEAYLLGGMDEINRMAGSELIDPETQGAWGMIDRGAAEGDEALLAEGNKHLLHREQWDIIADDYDSMRNHPITGEAVTLGMTTIGAPSIPGAQSFAEVFPEVISREAPYPWAMWTLPFVDNTFTVDAVTPFPDGNISNAQQRWNLITEDTLPAYQQLLNEDPDRAREIIASDFQTRLESQRIGNTVDDIVARLINGFTVEFDR